MVFITGDTHGEFSRFSNYKFLEDDLVIILGDAGINYFLDCRDIIAKEELKKYKCKFFCIHGNHEERPENIASYYEIDMFGGKVFIENAYPNILFAKNGEVYNIENKSVLVIGGAYSIDKNFRLQNGWNWFSSEQLTESERINILNKYKNKHIDVILSHTAPRKYEPTEVFLKIDQTNIDKTMEDFLNKIEENVYYDKWYCGHFHVDKQIDKLEFLFKSIKPFSINFK